MLKWLSYNAKTYPGHYGIYTRILILDVGCGCLGKHNPLKMNNVIHADKEKESFHLEMVCDVNFLPFKDNSFDIVHMSHLLEHVDSPIHVLRELKRISKNIVIIKVPNAIYHRVDADSPDHIYSWTQKTLTHLLSTVFREVHVYRSYQAMSRNKFETFKRLLLSLILETSELYAVCKKK